MTDRSAEVVIVSVSLAVLFVLFESAMSLDTVAVFVWLAVVELGTMKFTVTVADAPDASVPSAQVKLGLPAQMPCELLTVPRLKPAGNVSTRLTFVAAAGP